jgi:predicted RNase H-like HicB family nuclease
MPDTIAGYWMLHGYSLEEALQMQKEQIAKAIAQEELYEAMERDVF